MQLKLLKFNDPFEARARTNAKFIIKTPFVYTPGGVSSGFFMAVHDKGTMLCVIITWKSGLSG